MTLDLLLLLVAHAQVLWVYSSTILALSRLLGSLLPERVMRLCVTLASELRPLYLPAVVLQIAADAMAGRLLGWNAFFHGFALLAWWIFKDEGDDRWRKRRKRIREKVARRGARLVVIPAGGTA